MRNPQRPKPPATHSAYRGVLLAVLAVGLALVGWLVVFPGGLAVAGILRDVIESIYLAYSWEPF